nr:MAG TPA: hypothetical protein [Caudoviricetes sp.]
MVDLEQQESSITMVALEVIVKHIIHTKMTKTLLKSICD